MDRLRVLDLVYRTPWALQETTLRSMLELVQAWAAGRVESHAEVRARFGPRAWDRPEPAAAARPATANEGERERVAVLRVHGVIAHRAAMVDDICGPGGTSCERLGQQLDATVGNSKVCAIVLDVDSPGGSVFGVEELASRVYEARQQKPITAVVNATASSAAYWIASQAGEIVVTPSGEVGSVGVFGVHEDHRKAAEQQGIAVTLIHAGRYKVEGSPWTELTADAQGHMQAQVNRYYEAFIRAVARGRGVEVPQKQIEEGTAFGGGRTFTAEEAGRLGLVDGLGTLDATVERLTRETAAVRRAALGDDARRRCARLASLK
jgi:signal peptide peptidase SppA